MPFFDQISPEPDLIVEEPPYPAIVDRVETLETVFPHPTHPEWGATVYIDPAKYPDNMAREQTYAYYARRFRGRTFRFVELSSSDLEYWSPFFTKRSEQRFLQRGFYSDIETAKYKTGVGDDILLRTRRMESTCGHQLSKIAGFYAGAGQAMLMWDEALGYLMGRFGEPVPLVKEETVYWPRRTFLQPSTMHFAYVQSFKAALKEGAADSFGLTRATADDIRRQVAFESENAPHIFNGASREALFVWQTQVLAMLRKATWEASFAMRKCALDVARDIAEARAEMLVEIEENGADALDPDDLAFKHPISGTLEQMEDAFRQDLAGQVDGYGIGIGASTIEHGLTSAEILVAALHGATYRPSLDGEDGVARHDPLYVLFPIALWLGRLKREKYMPLTETVANDILAVAAIVEDDEAVLSCRGFKPMLRERFGDAGWDAIVETAHEVVVTKRVIAIRYDWSTDPLRPRARRQHSGGLILEGPLLDFPLREAAIWNERALGLRDRLALPRW